MKSIKQMIQEKREWKAQMKRVNKLPRDYKIVYKEVEKYLFSLSAGDGMDTVAGIYQLIDFLEEGAAQQIPVLDYVGRDVGQFAESFRQSLQTKSWSDSFQTNMQDKVTKQLNKLNREDKHDE